jgi:hypothetical protein
MQGLNSELNKFQFQFVFPFEKFIKYKNPLSH